MPFQLVFYDSIWVLDVPYPL